MIRDRHERAQGVEEPSGVVFCASRSQTEPTAGTTTSEQQSSAASDNEYLDEHLVGGKAHIKQASHPELQDRKDEELSPELQGNSSENDRHPRQHASTSSISSSPPRPSAHTNRTETNPKLSLDIAAPHHRLQPHPRGVIDSETHRAMNTPAAPSKAIEVVMKSVEVQSPNTTLRNRRSNRSGHSVSSSDHFHRLPSAEDSGNNNPVSLPDGVGTGMAPLSMQRKPSLSSVRDHVPAGINTESGPFKLCVDESSPVETSQKRSQLSIELQETEAGVDGIEIIKEKKGDEDDDFDWEEDKIYEDKEKESEANAQQMTMIEGDVCCRPLHRIHPWITKLLKHAFIIVLFLIPKFILHHVHTHHHQTIVLIENGKPYMAVVIGNHLGYFVIQFLIMAVFKIIHKFGSVKVKITLETHDALVPHIARSVWLFGLIAFWAVFVHTPSCTKAQSELEFPESIEEGIDMNCRRWVFWWVHRCLWGLQAMNMLYILKRYSMQILSDRFEQDNSKFVELNFQGHVLDGLQKIKQHRSHRSSVLHGHHYRWAEKSTSWLATTYQGGRSPNLSRPSSSKDEKPPTASVIAETAQKRTAWELLRNSFQRRAKKAKGSKIGSATSPSGSIVDTYKDHELEPQEFVRMSKKRKSKLIHSLRNKPIENPYKKAKDLWARICPPHRNHLERVDLEQPFKKDIMDRVWRLFDPNGGDIITRAMFKQAIVDMVSLRKSFTSTHRTFENAMAKLDMLFNIVVLLFVIVAFLIVYDVGVQQYAVGVSSLVVGCAFVTGTSAKNAFESMIFIFVMRPFDVGDRIELDGAYFLITTIHILTTEMKRGDGMRVLAPNYLLATRQINNVSRSDDHVDSIWMDIPLFSSGRTIQKLKQKILVFCEGEAQADFQKIDVILNATNNHTKDGTSKACLQILFRVFHRSRWVDPDFGPRKLKSILFLRATLNELEQEDLNDLIAVRRAIGYGNHVLGANYAQYPPVLNEVGGPVGFVGTSGNVYDSPHGCGPLSNGSGANASVLRNDLPGPGVGDLGTLYLSHAFSQSTAQRSPPAHVYEQQRPSSDSSSSTGPGVLQDSHGLGVDGQNSIHSLGARHLLVPETIQLSTNPANFQPFPNGFQFQR